MCWKTENGYVENFGEFKLSQRMSTLYFLRTARYVIYKEEDDILGLKYAAVCIDFEVEAKGKSPTDAYEGLKKAVNAYISFTLNKFNDKYKAYGFLIDQATSRSEPREKAYASYKAAYAHYLELLNYRKMNIFIILTRIWFSIQKRIPFSSWLFSPRAIAYDGQLNDITKSELMGLVYAMAGIRAF